MLATDAAVARALASVVDTPDLVRGLRAAEALANSSAVTTDPTDTAGRLAAAIADGDQFTSIAAIHAVSAAPGPTAAGLLVELLADRRWHVAEHAAWALSARSTQPSALGTLVDLVAAGEFTGMLAQRTLEGWARTDGELVQAAVSGALAGEATDGGRRRLMETLGLVGTAQAMAVAASVATDRAEVPPTRIAAVAALADHSHDASTLAELAAGDDEVAAHAQLALADRSPSRLAAPTSRARGLSVAQLFLHADHEDGRPGTGDHGGIATLLKLVSAELAGHQDIAEILTIGRGDVSSAFADHWAPPDEIERFAVVPFGPPGGIDLRSAWTYRVQIERGVRRVLHRPIDALHLRMADVGTLAAARVARQLDIPVVFTAAPDPHVVVRSLQADDQLRRNNFGDADVLEHYWFRARMVERLLRQADRVVVLPRAHIARDLRELLGWDVDEHPDRVAVIPEGVHAASVRRAGGDVRRAQRDALPSGVDVLAAAIATLPAARRSLPLLVCVGRMHRSKGVSRLVEAWATTSSLQSATNVALIGGDLTSPTPDELDVLAEIDDLTAGLDGMFLLGHQPHADVARILAAAAAGAPGVPGAGVYVGAARKEEFGLALLEALAAGLPVVAPAGGGPATYVRDGMTGVLVEGSSTAALVAAIGRALDLRSRPGRVEQAAHDVLDELTIENMAARLAELYGSLARVTTR
ncbi:MAG: glycosyltransferase [Ilumatobacteraceae bacterium]